MRKISIYLLGGIALLLILAGATVVFTVIAGSLQAIAYLTGLTYNEVNIILYFFMIPFTWVCLLDKYFRFHWLKILFGLLCAAFFILCDNFKLFSDNLFDVSVVFLQWFGHLNMNYYLASVVICVIVPIIVYALLFLLIKKRHGWNFPKPIFSRKIKLWIISGATLLLMILVLSFLFRNIIFINTFQYKMKHIVNQSTPINEEFIAYINRYCGAGSQYSREEIQDLSLTITADALEYTTHSPDIVNPNKLLQKGVTHCGGYSVFYAATFNYLIDKYGLQKDWKARAYAVEVYMFWQPVFPSHVFVVMENRRTGEKVTVDPTIYDFFYTPCVGITMF